MAPHMLDSKITSEALEVAPTFPRRPCVTWVNPEAPHGPVSDSVMLEAIKQQWTTTNNSNLSFGRISKETQIIVSSNTPENSFFPSFLFPQLLYNLCWGSQTINTSLSKSCFWVSQILNPRGFQVSSFYWIPLPVPHSSLGLSIQS